MDWEGVTKAIVTVGTPLATLIGFGGRRYRLRKEIRDNLALLSELEADEILSKHTPAPGWLQGRIALDVARLTGRELGTPKKPIPWGSVVMAVILGLGFALWTFWIVRERFYWYAVFPGVVAALMAVSILGMTTNRELPPEDADELPPGATPVRTDRNDERVLASIDLAAGGAGDISARFEPTGQVGCAFAFLAAMRDGRFEAGLSFADDRWLLCRVQAYLWNNQATFGSDIDVLADIAESLTRQRNQAEEWASFVAVEASQFQQVWGPLNPANYGAASRRRRLSGDHELVVLAPVGNTGGYFVTTATALLDALTFVVHFEGGRWLVANHVGTAPPAPGWPPIWWSTQDPVVEALPEP